MEDERSLYEVCLLVLSCCEPVRGFSRCLIVSIGVGCGHPTQCCSCHKPVLIWNPRFDHLDLHVWPIENGLLLAGACAALDKVCAHGCSRFLCCDVQHEV